MIDIVSQMVGYDSKNLHIIERWVVMFQTPFGLFEKVEEAIERVRQADLVPDLVVVPIAVAIGDNGRIVEPSLRL